MRFLIDNSLSPTLAERLSTIGHDAVHIRDLMAPNTEDEIILTFAAAHHRIVVAQDTDFGTILAARATPQPSVILFRTQRRSTEAIAPMLVAALPGLKADLESGAVVVFEDTRIRVRRLPIV